MSQLNADVTTQAYSNFEEDEKSMQSLPFKTFFTSGDPVVFQTQNRFEGKSSFLSYYPTSDMAEQKLEKFWFANQNKIIQEKRLGEETKVSVREWSEAKSRIEEEIQRRKEHAKQGSNFQKARSFVRKSWKTKNFNPLSNPLLEESSDDDYGDEDQPDFT